MKALKNNVYFCQKYLKMSRFFFLRLSVVLLLFPLLSACSHSGANSNATTPDSSATVAYAKGFAIDYFAHYTRVTVFNPWKKGAVQACYYVTYKANTSTPDKSKTVVAPLTSLAATSATHYAFVAALHQLLSITGISSPQLVYNPELLQQFQHGHITDLGDPFSLNVEKTMALKPQALMMSSYNQTDPAAERISQAGIPVIFNNEWMETSPLGRAEWIKFVAVFYHKEKMADSIFNALEKRYLSIQSLALKAEKKPSVMIGNNFKGTWYVPSGKGFMGHILADAQLNYFFATDTTTGSIPINFEKALQHFVDADIWLNCDVDYLQALPASDTRYSLFKAYRNKQVYTLKQRVTAAGGNDFWEGGVMHPDLILSDFVKVLHPELLPDYQLTYVKKLE